MMVSKVVVIALVAVIAVPILIGYAFNLEETTETGYRTTGEAVNVTPLLQNSTAYSYASADPYDLNTKFVIKEQGNTTLAKSIPLFEKTSFVKSSLPMEKFVYDTGGDAPPGSHPNAKLPLSTFNYMYFQSDYSGTGDYVNFTIYDTSNNVYLSILKVHTIAWDAPTSTLTYSTYYTIYGELDIHTYSTTIPNPDFEYQFTDYGSYNSPGYLEREYADHLVDTYADISAGYRFKGLGGTYNKVQSDLPNSFKDILLTVDLNTLTGSTETFDIILKNYTNRLIFNKVTDGDGIHWTVSMLPTLTLIADLYYDSSRSSNTYQIYMDLNGGSIRYVGDWPTVIGPANYYTDYQFEWNATPSQFAGIELDKDTPVMRIDSATYPAFEYQVIENGTYDPVSIKSNPLTTINNPTEYGTSLSFGGNTYTVSDGNITLNGHKVPVKGLVLSSVPNEGGGYDNKIGNTVISTTAAPSTITFNGKWSASISTVAQESYTYTVSEWKAGEFAWDGIDHNFLIVGLITCLGVFIGCGIYARKSRSGGVIPLMIVTGCAAFVFFIML